MTGPDASCVDWTDQSRTESSPFSETESPLPKTRAAWGMP